LLENYFNMRDENYSEDKLISRLEENIINPQTEKMESMVLNQKHLFELFVEELTKKTICENTI